MLIAFKPRITPNFFMQLRLCNNDCVTSPRTSSNHYLTLFAAHACQVELDTLECCLECINGY
jgi:hypothetical protein